MIMMAEDAAEHGAGADDLAVPRVPARGEHAADYQVSAPGQGGRLACVHASTRAVARLPARSTLHAAYGTWALYRLYVVCAPTSTAVRANHPNPERKRPLAQLARG